MLFRTFYGMLCLLFLVASPSAAAVPLSICEVPTSQTHLMLTRTDVPYHITCAPWRISAGDTVTLGPGAVLSWADSVAGEKRVEVYGTLRLLGQDGRRAIVGRAPWKGIQVHQGGELECDRCEVNKTIVAVSCLQCVSLEVKQGVFNESSLLISDSPPDTIRFQKPFDNRLSYRTGMGKVVPKPSALQDQKGSTLTVATEAQPASGPELEPRGMKRVWVWAGAAAGVAGIVAAILWLPSSDGDSAGREEARLDTFQNIPELPAPGK